MQVTAVMKIIFYGAKINTKFCNHKSTMKLDYKTCMEFENLIATDFGALQDH